MKYRIRKACCIALLIFPFSTLFFSGTGAEQVEHSTFVKAESADRYEELLSSETLSFSLNTATGEISVLDRITNLSYDSNPADAQDNENLTGSARTAARSQLILTLSDKQGNQTVINSLVASVNKGGLEVYTSGESVKCVYQFPDYGIEIPLVYRLEGGRFVAEIPVDEIISRDDPLYLSEISLLPYFGAATVDEDGWLLVPDGCGSLISFHSAGKPQYSQLLYGADRGKQVKTMSASEQPALLPAVATFYADRGESGTALMKYVESGAALATVCASAETADRCYNTAYFTFTYRSSDNVTLMDRTSKASNVVIHEKSPVSCDKFSVSFTFLDSGSANLIGIAERVRERIYDGFTVPQVTTELPVYIESYMGVRKTKYFLGIPYNGFQKLTDIDDCRQMLDDFSQIPVVMSLIGLDSDGASGGRIDKALKVTGTIGSVNDLESLIAQAADSGSAVYPSAEFTEFTKGNRNERVLSVSNQVIEIPFFDYGSKELKTAYDGLYLLKSHAIAENVSSWIASAKKQGINTCAPSTLSVSPYRSDSTEDRNAALLAFCKAFDSFAQEDVSLLLSQAAAYAIPYARHINNMPVSSSGFAACGTEVPFLQMVLHGTVSYSMPPVNLSGNSEFSFLKAIETGSSLSFAFTTADYTALKETPLDRLNGSDYSLWRDTAVSMADELAEIMQGTAATYITDYQILSEDVRYVAYGNGNSYLLNYGNATYRYGDISVEPMSYYQICEEVQE